MTLRLPFGMLLPTGGTKMRKTFECQDCGRRYFEGEMPREFPDVKDLAERVAPGELVPAGECECGALVHEILGEFTSSGVVKFVIGDEHVLCSNDRGRLSQVGVVQDGRFEENEGVGVVRVDLLSLDEALGSEWDYSELFDGLSEGSLVIGEFGIVSKKGVGQE